MVRRESGRRTMTTLSIRPRQPAGGSGSGSGAGGRAALSPIDARLAALDHSALMASLDAQGYAIVSSLLDRDACESLVDAYDDDALFRSKVVMARHGFGQGEYKYFAYPLPDVVAGLRASLYPGLAGIANAWNERMGIDVRYPEHLAEFLERCHRAGQTRPTPLLLRYGAGDYNCLHQDIYGEHVFPAAAGGLAQRARQGLRRRRIRADRTTAAHAVACQRRVALARRRRDLRGAASAGAGNARQLSGQHAPRREPAAFGLTPYARGDLLRRRLTNESTASNACVDRRGIYQRFLPSITVTGASAATKSSNSRALTPMRRVLPSQLPSGSNAGLSVKVVQPQVGQKWCATCLEFQR